MSDSRAYLEQHFATLQGTGQAIEAGHLSIIEGGPRFRNSLHQLSTFLELTDDFWMETGDWVFTNMSGAHGAEFEAWRELAVYIVDRMPDHIRNQTVQE
ncbi:hypothetical protein [Tessaracoccus massiliensis]|uniref:hypothetical protein n=1 Tax=Tessaracoccus massiliensis TaxID=1522311 RepID=UPI0005910567|nr:hypothetical protein [Tessaracoccus massiliensis]